MVKIQFLSTCMTLYLNSYITVFVNKVNKYYIWLSHKDKTNLDQRRPSRDLPHIFERLFGSTLNILNDCSAF